MKPVVILSNHDEVKDMEFGESVDVWAMNIRAMNKKHADLVLDVHSLEYLKESSGEKYLEWLRSLSVPVYMREKYLPNATRYPFEEVYELTKLVMFKGKPLKFLTSSPVYLIALAILQKRPQVSVYGFEFRDIAEYKKQTHGFAFWTGFAAGRGISLDIPCADVIFNQPIYGAI